MKSIMLAGAALMGIASIGSAAIAQQMPASQAPGDAMTPPPAEAKDYPVCSKTVTDSCINPADARKMRKR